jgi:hypothetical protein
MKNSYGNYVIQKALLLAEGNYKENLALAIQKNIPLLPEQKLRAKWVQILEEALSKDHSKFPIDLTSPARKPLQGISILSPPQRQVNPVYSPQLSQPYHGHMFSSPQQMSYSQFLQHQQQQQPQQQQQQQPTYIIISSCPHQNPNLNMLNQLPLQVAQAVQSTQNGQTHSTPPSYFYTQNQQPQHQQPQQQPQQVQYITLTNNPQIPIHQQQPHVHHQQPVNYELFNWN